MADGILWGLANASNLDPLGNFVRGAETGQKLNMEAARRNTLAQLAQGGATPDYGAATRNLLAAGDLSGANSVATIGQTLGGGKPTDEMREYSLYKQQGGTGSFFDYKTGLKRAGATRINNSVTTGDNAYSKVLNENEAKRFLGFQKAAQTSQGMLNTLGVMDNLMKDPNFTSGAGAERFSLPLRQAISQLGGDPKAAASMETFRALANKATLDIMGGSLGAGISNGDRDFVVNQVPGLGNTPEGNRQLIGILQKVNQRTIQVAKFAREYAKQNGGKLDSGFDDQLQAWAEKNPLFPQQQQQQSQPQPQQIAPQAAPSFDRGAIQQELQRRGVKIQ